MGSTGAVFACVAAGAGALVAAGALAGWVAVAAWIGLRAFRTKGLQRWPGVAL